eukprot:2901178-Prorocentrum_lima.AAC.1
MCQEGASEYVSRALNSYIPKRSSSKHRSLRRDRISEPEGSTICATRALRPLRHIRSPWTYVTAR